MTVKYRLIKYHFRVVALISIIKDMRLQKTYKVRSQSDNNVVYSIDYYEGGYMKCNCVNYEMINLHSFPPFNSDCKHCKFIRNKYYGNNTK